jgi:glycosyltransferase involved in cell wall biosynthesis/predicted O-methyltransferase YrrM
MPSPLPDKDYVSPGLCVVVPDAHFPRMRVGDRSNHPWKYLRREVPHLWYADDRFPLMGFMNRDEAAILYNLALQFAGRLALEIGGWLGWSTCHLALAGVKLDVIDPAHAEPDIRAIVDQSLAGCGVSANVNLIANRSPEGVHEIATAHGKTWNLFVIDGDHDEPAPERDVQACLPYAARDCAFVFHDLASPAVAAGLRFLQREGFNVLIYQTAQIIGFAWRGQVMPVEHVPDPEVPWQLPHHLVGLPVSGVAFDAPKGNGAGLLIGPCEATEASGARLKESFVSDFGINRELRPSYRLLRDAHPGEAEDWRPSVCIVSSEVVGPFKNGGIGTSMTGLAEHLAASGFRVTILYTGGIWSPDIQLGKWQKRYENLGIDFEAISIEKMKSVEGPLRDCGFGTPYLVYQYLAAKHFDIVHFNDCAGEGSLCLVAKKLGLAFQNTLLLVALHSPSQWVLELNQTLPTSFLLSAFNYAERLSVKCADVLWSPSGYLVDWALRQGFELPKHTFVQQYCLPSQRLRERGEGPSHFPAVRYGRTTRPKEIVFFGRLEERKGMRLFCNAIHRLRDELADRGISVTFLGKVGTCGGMSASAYIAHRSSMWRFPVKTVTNFGQPEALGYMLSGEKLAVMSSPVDNSPCTVYEALAWGIPFLATRTGGIPELVRQSDHDSVLFDYTTESLCKALIATLDAGGWIAAPSQSQEETRRVWSSFHADSRRYLTPRRNGARAGRVVAIVDGHSAMDFRVTLESLAAIGGVHHVVVLNRDGVSLLPTAGKFSIRNIDLSVEDSGALDEEIEKLNDEVILMIHAGIGIRSDFFAGMLSALNNADIDGLQPAAEVVGGPTRRIVLPLGGDPSFTLFEGATFTGGLLVRTEAFKRAKLGRGFAVESTFMGLADFCVTRGIEIWPYPEPVFELPEHWRVGAPRPLPARVTAFDDCSPTDRYYMLAAGYGIGTNERPMEQKKLMALDMIDLGLPRVVRYASWALRNLRGIRSRLLLGRIERRLEGLLRGNG